MTWSLDALKKNRVSALVFGGTEADRRAFAVAASEALEGAGGLIEAKDAASVERARRPVGTRVGTRQGWT
jgi:hypothetical protein